MIEVNLLPGGKKRSKARKGLPVGLPALKGFPTDRWVQVAIGLGTVAILSMGWLFFGLRSEEEEVRVAVDEAVQDSARFADLIRQVDGLIARRDSIITRVDIIQRIDQGRYVWPHLMDELARALPDYTWLTEFVEVGGGLDGVRVELQGRAGNPFALAVFMEQIEASPYMRGVRLIQSEQAVEASGGLNRIVYAFRIEFEYEAPPIELIETVPLFDEAEPVLPSTGS